MISQSFGSLDRLALTENLDGFDQDGNLKTFSKTLNSQCTFPLFRSADFRVVISKAVKTHFKGSSLRINVTLTQV